MYGSYSSFDVVLFDLVVYESTRSTVPVAVIAIPEDGLTMTIPGETLNKLRFDVSKKFARYAIRIPNHQSFIGVRDHERVALEILVHLCYSPIEPYE